MPFDVVVGPDGDWSFGDGIEVEASESVLAAEYADGRAWWMVSAMAAAAGSTGMRCSSGSQMSAGQPAVLMPEGLCQTCL